MGAQSKGAYTKGRLRKLQKKGTVEAEGGFSERGQICPKTGTIREGGTLRSTSRGAYRVYCAIDIERERSRWRGVGQNRSRADDKKL